MTLRDSVLARLGLAPESRAIILNADDFGMCQAANDAIIPLLDAGAIDSATVMVPCSWSPQALSYAAGSSTEVGVHLVLTSEWQRYRWRPLTGTGTSLVDDDGFFHATAADVERTVTTEDVAAELEAQLTAALAAGVDVTHLDNHMGSVYGMETGRDFIAEVLELAAKYRLPFRLPRTFDGLGQASEVQQPAEVQQALDAATAAADALGVVIIDRLWTHPFALENEGTDTEETYEEVREGFLDLLRRVRPGVTEIFLHPMTPGAELDDIADYGARKRGYEQRLLTDPKVAEVIESEGIVRVSWRALRTAQQANEAVPVVAE